tara:strand:- start:4 stop:591 length:588 start_codon:yes stop_codon:yes gene_type:complete
MSKSAGNFYTLRDILKKGYSPEAIRYTLISTHYRSKLNFTFDKVSASQKCINKLIELKRRLQRIEDDGSEEKPNKETENMLSKFSDKLSDDLNISGALGELFSWVSSLFVQLDGETLDYSSARGSLSALYLVDTVLGVLGDTGEEVDKNIQQLIDARNKAREEKDWARADEIRNQLDDIGIILDDTPDGTIWKKK